ncbi:hypothetical protein AVEN_138778-1 [Araneus ventricosus]|uniref:Uncharacterized protein n=1 Tax=Araneus ventricosus TaxID=182803 RepID=A0A4Y2FMK7_ARAVE|nr:hypothetical protein AVEN_138778-1 [Araneus ventricosus]
MWRLNEFNLSHKSHTVVRLAVHLPQQQPIVYQDGQEAQAIERAALRKTTLTSWFELNKNDPSAHNISYSDIPQYYVFDKSTTNWKKRQRGGQNVIGRLPVVSILDSERYYLRMLLLRKSGAISVDDILTVNGLRCITFQQACQEYGLLRGHLRSMFPFSARKMWWDIPMSDCGNRTYGQSDTLHQRFPTFLVLRTTC